MCPNLTVNYLNFTITESSASNAVKTIVNFLSSLHGFANKVSVGYCTVLNPIPTQRKRGR